MLRFLKDFKAGLIVFMKKQFLPYVKCSARHKQVILRLPSNPYLTLIWFFTFKFVMFGKDKSRRR